MAPDDYYVAVLEAADHWLALIDQDDEPTDDDWNAAHDALADAVEAVRAFEISEGTALRAEPWGGRRAATFEVIDAADAWLTLSELDDAAEADLDAVHDRLGDAVRALQSAESA